MYTFGEFVAKWNILGKKQHDKLLLAGVVVRERGANMSPNAAQNSYSRLKKVNVGTPSSLAC